MKFTVASSLLLVAAAAKVSADCFSTRLGYPCCSSWNQSEIYRDNDGAWGIENGNWCGLGQTSQATEQCTGQNQGYSCCNSCTVSYTDADGAWGIENGNWCGIKKTCNGQSQQTTTTKKTTTTTQQQSSTNIPNVTGGQNGVTTRYWDCCVASCSWDTNTNAQRPVNVCQKDGRTLIPNFDWKIQSVCNGGSGYMCNDNQPWAINDKLSYGFAAASLTSGTQKEWCCSCQRLQFTSGPVKGKQMVVQVTNTGGDLGSNHFDLQMPGGGVGIYNGCSSQWGAGNDGWGSRYGGVSSVSDCNSLPTELQEGCKWRFNWFLNADNPSVTFERVQCPKELTDISGCIPADDASQKKVPW